MFIPLKSIVYFLSAGGISALGYSIYCLSISKNNLLDRLSLDGMRLLNFSSGENEDKGEWEVRAEFYKKLKSTVFSSAISNTESLDSSNLVSKLKEECKKISKDTGFESDYEKIRTWCATENMS